MAVKKVAKKTVKTAKAVETESAPIVFAAAPERHEGLLVVSKRDVLVGAVLHTELTLENRSTAIVPKS